MENFQNTLKYMDTFGIKYHFYIDKKKNYYSILGGILSLIALIIGLGIFIFASLKRLNPSITSIIYSDSHNKFEKDKIFLAWKIIDENNNSINYSNLTIEYYSLEGNEDNIKSINYSFCNQTSMINNKKVNNKIIFPDLRDLFCIDLGDAFNNNSHFITGNIIFNIFLNKNNDTNSLILKFLIPTIKFDSENSAEPLYNIYQNHYRYLKNNIIKNEKIILGKYSVFDKFGFFGNKQKVFSLWGINFFFTDNLNININNNDGTLPIYSLNILLDKTKIKYKRDYPNIFYIFVEIYPICYIIFKFVKYIFKYFIIAEANSKIAEILFENIQKENKTDIYKDKIRFKSLYGFQSPNYKKNNTKNYNNILDNNNNRNITCNENNIQNGDQSNSNKKDNLIDKNLIKSSEKNVTNFKLVKAVRKKSRRSVNFGEISNKNMNIFNMNQNNDINKNNNNDNSININDSKNEILNDNKLLVSPTHRHKRNKKMQLFPFKYYFFSTFLKNYEIMKCQSTFSKKFKSVFSFINQILDVNTYLFQKKEFEIMKNLFCNKDDLSLIENKKKININNTKFTREIKECVENNKFSIFFHKQK